MPQVSSYQKCPPIVGVHSPIDARQRIAARRRDTHGDEVAPKISLAPRKYLENFRYYLSTRGIARHFGLIYAPNMVNMPTLLWRNRSKTATRLFVMSGPFERFLFKKVLSNSAAASKTMRIDIGLFVIKDGVVWEIPTYAIPTVYLFVGESSSKTLLDISLHDVLAKSSFSGFLQHLLNNTGCLSDILLLLGKLGFFSFHSKPTT